MSKKGNRKRRNLANKLLQKQVGYLLEPSLKPDKELIRKTLIKALRKEGWKSPSNNPYQRKKFYDEWTDKIAKIQMQKGIDGRTLRSVNKNLSKWKKSTEFEEISKPKDLGPGVDVPFKNSQIIFEWMDSLAFVGRNHPDFLYEVLIDWTGGFWRGKLENIRKNQTAITAEAKASGYEGAGYKISVDHKNKVVRITFSKTAL